MARFDPDLDGQTRAFPKMRKQTSASGCSQVDSHCEDCKRIKHKITRSQYVMIPVEHATLKSILLKCWLFNFDVVNLSFTKAGRAGRTRPGKCFRLYTLEACDIVGTT